MKKNKGITIMVLIITIAVTIILAGISINLVVGDNGVISKSKNAKIENLRIQILDEIENETKLSVDEFGDYDQEIAIKNIQEKFHQLKEIVAQIDGRLGITIEEQDSELKYIVSNKGEVILVSEYICKKEDVDSKVYELLAPIPLGFSVKDETENKIENGLVIVEQNTADEYIWIPVKEKELNSLLVADKNGDLYYHETIKIGEEEKYKIVEPYFVSAQNVNVNGSDFEAKEFNMLLRKKFNDLIKSIKNNGGFYISKEKLNINNGNWINCWREQSNLKNKYNENEKIFTSMIYGFQTKLVGKFFEDVGETNNFVVTQSALLDVGGENSEFKFTNMKISSGDDIEINNIATKLGTYTILYFE